MAAFRLLFIDAYDSFSNNIVSLLETELPVSVTKIHIDSDVGDLSTFLQSFVAVVAGPGPGNPENLNDVGLIAELWKLNEDALLPCLGICLGFQSLVLSFGGRIIHLPGPRHGTETCITTCGKSLFEGQRDINSIQYHSLQAVLNDAGSLTCSSLTTDLDVWKPTLHCPDLVPLAWDFTPSGTLKSQGVSNLQPILMAVRHHSKPFYGIQFHPESVCSSETAKSVIKRWWALCLQWLQNNRPHHLWPCRSSDLPHLTFSSELELHRSSLQSTPDSSRSLSSSESLESLSSVSSYPYSIENSLEEIHCHRRIPLGQLSVSAVVTRLGLAASDIVVMDSETRQMPNLGAYSIIGVIEADTLRLNYTVANRMVKIMGHDGVSVDHLKSKESIFSYLKNFLKPRAVTRGPQQIPFWGGLMGYIAYEACLETISVRSMSKPNHPDLSFAFIERSIVIDHVHQTLYVQSIKPEDLHWIIKVRSTLLQGNPGQSIRSDNSGAPYTPTSKRMPDERNYKHKISLCQKEIREGNSYEICLTNQALIKLKRSDNQLSSWAMYLKLRRINPAPFASFLQLGSVTILSTSPERFMSWTRPRFQGDDHANSVSTCQFRPIKGTVSKIRAMHEGGTQEVSLEEATATLSTQKERAENLMIVDLIRHDLHGVVGSGNVAVKSLMAVEEYESVFQLVSVIEGTISNVHDHRAGFRGFDSITGIDVLAASLPPGSMTGAPKKRSCELLQSIEDEPRSIYSGVIGYMCVGGGGDFSVVIRTMYKFGDDENEDTESWKLGAGGAITTLSNEADEWEEMLVKLKSTIRLFDN